MGLIEKFLRRFVPYKELGWEKIGEKFTRFQLLKTRWFNIYLHKLDALEWHPYCHDHPWGFVAILLRSGYLEQVGDKFFRRRVGSILYRPATFSHNVTTPFGISWSLIFTTAKKRDWGFVECRHESDS